MELSLAQKAIDFALDGRFEEAIDVNLQILEENPNDIDALNRLARAYSETGKVKAAKITTKKVLAIDPVNSIALKCLEKWNSSNFEHAGGSATDSNAFLEESGKTKIVDLIKIGDDKLLSSLDPGEEVKLFTHPHKTSVVTFEEKYVGALPDDLGARLRALIKSGGKYKVLVKSAGPKGISVFIKEIEKAKNFSGPSFPPEKIDYVSFTPPELVHKKGPIEIGEDLEDA